MTLERGISDLDAHRLKNHVKFKVLQEEVKTLAENN